MPRSWNALALFKGPVLSGHQYLRLPLGNPQFFNLLLYLLTFLDHPIASFASCFSYQLAAAAKWSLQQVSRQKSVNKHNTSNVYTWSLPSKVDPFVYISSESFPTENGSLQWLKMLSVPRRWTKQQVQTICSLLQKSTFCCHVRHRLLLWPSHLRRGYNRPGKGSKRQWGCMESLYIRDDKVIFRNEISDRTVEQQVAWRW